MVNFAEIIKKYRYLLIILLVFAAIFFYYGLNKKQNEDTESLGQYYIPSKTGIRVYSFVGIVKEVGNGLIIANFDSDSINRTKILGIGVTDFNEDVKILFSDETEFVDRSNQKDIVQDEVGITVYTFSDNLADPNSLRKGDKIIIEYENPLMHKSEEVAVKIIKLN